MAFEAKPIHVTSNVPYEDGLQPVTWEDGLYVDPNSPYPPQAQVQDPTEPSNYPPSDQRVSYPTPDGTYQYASELPSTNSRGICGLKRRTSVILLVVIAVVILAAAIGGGVGGTLSHNKQAASTTVTVLSLSGTAIPGSSSTTFSSASPTGTSKPGYCAEAVPNWIYQGRVAVGIGRDGLGVVFADLNGDGRVEYLYVETDGSVIAYLNLGSPNPNPLNAGQVSWLNQGVIALGVGGVRDQIRFADLDGDGKADYIWVHDNGTADAWLNMGGPNDGADAAKVTWLAQGTIASGMGPDGANVVFADVNGDGRADYLWLDPNSGDVTAYLNTGPKNNNRSEAGQVGWKPAGIIASGFTVGSGNAREVAGARFADMNGDGRLDYCVLSYVNGNVTLWHNDPSANGNGSIIWTPEGVIAAGVGDDGRTVQFGDLNGDGRWEYLDVNSTSGAVNAWLNGCFASAN